ncbi:SWR1 complex bromodomain subunit bdf1 [Diplonema papillatum]|nr:SWR1 complex bromodomain subunit bdf1 [Diplonema papillatum]
MAAAAGDAVALFWETDSEDEPDGPHWWAAGDALKVTEADGGPTRPPKEPSPECESRAAAAETVNRTASAIFDRVVQTLGAGVADKVAMDQKHPSGLTFAEVLDYHTHCAAIRARLDLGEYTKLQQFEADVVSMLLNAIVLHTSTTQELTPVQLQARSTLPRLGGLFRDEYDGDDDDNALSTMVCTMRFSGRQPPSGVANTHAPAYHRILQKFTLLDHRSLFQTRPTVNTVQGFVSGAVCLPDLKEGVQRGVYATDLDFELDLRCLFMSIMMNTPANSLQWSEARRLLFVVPECLEEAGILPYCVPLKPMPPFPPGFGLTKDEESKCRRALLEFKRLDTNCLFESPVERILRYRKVIQRPMDLTTVQLKLTQGKYMSTASFKDDLMLILQNCKCFNSQRGPGSGIYAAAEYIQGELAKFLAVVGL